MVANKVLMLNFVWLKRILLFAAVCFTAFGASNSFAQSTTQVAGMAQDIQIINKRVNQLSLQMELFKNRQEQLQQTLDAFLKQQTDLVTEFDTLTVSVNTRLQSIEDREPEMKREILAEVADKMTQLATEMQFALDALEKAIEKTPGSQPKTVQFDDDYPRTGFAYTVKPGDSLSKIAREYGSTVSDIRNANKIVNPRTDLHIGQIIFVPQRN